MRTLASLPGYLATTDADGLQLHQYSSSRLTADVGGGEAEIAVETDYPWDGSIRVSVTDAPATDWTLSMRVPAWADGAKVRVNDEDVQEVASGSYATLRRRWEAGDVVELSLPMTVRFVEADDRIDAILRCVALERGPLVFAVEQVDQTGGSVVDDLTVDPTAPTTTEYRPDLLGGVTVITARGRAHHHVQQAWPYQPAGNTPTDDGDDVDVTAIPYFAWANRGPGPMRVWLTRG
jgi:DUF1680 family protein